MCTKSQKPRILLKSRPDCARIFTKMSLDEKLVTLQLAGWSECFADAPESNTIKCMD